MMRRSVLEMLTLGLAAASCPSIVAASSNPGHCRKPLILGVGGAANNICHQLVSLGEWTDIAVADTDAVALCRSPAMCVQVQLGKSDAEAEAEAEAGVRQGWRAAMALRTDLESILTARRDLILVAGWGGGTATSATPYIAHRARARGMRVIAIVVQPFSFEMCMKSDAMRALQIIDKLAHQLYCLDMESNLSGDETLTSVFKRVDRRSLQLVRDSLLVMHSNAALARIRQTVQCNIA